MKKILLFSFLCLVSLIMRSQTSNIISIPDIKASLGDVQLPVNISNTDEIVAAQFDLTLPAGVTAGTNVTLTNRSDGHVAVARNMGSGKYRVMLYAQPTTPLLGQSGTVMNIPINIPNSYEEGAELKVEISDAILSKSTGENVLTTAVAGTITISKLPDLIVKNITADKQILSPGDHLVCSWQVENIGELTTGGGWSEQLLLVSSDDIQSKLIATTHYDDILDASGIVSRQADVTLPFLLGIDGQVKLQVRIVPDSKTGESASALANNTQASASILAINKLLSLELSPKRIDENSTQHIALKVNRSGRWSVAETFTIVATADSRVNVPTSITIPANQSGAVVYFRLTDNNVLDNDTAVNITVTGNDYPEAETTLVIDDNELPSLSVTASKTDVSEGETFQLTITTSRVSANPITVMLTSENARRFNFPVEVVIPAGEASVTVDITAIDNDEIEIEESIAFRASAVRHERGECIIMLGDNDMPTLSFTLSPEAVSEADGYAALFGVIKRTDNLDKRVTLKLTDDSNSLLTYTNQTIVMAKGQAEVQFNIGVTDNDLVDGNHVVNVTAAVYASSCDCSVSGDNKGSMTATVTIIDDDGPTLKIKPAGTAMLEGSEGNIFAISHNVQSDADVIVRISSDKDDMLEYDHELTIPAGQSTANLLVNVKSNDQQDDSSIAAFKVEADGYAIGTCWILITDQTLPDAIVSLTADKSEAEAEGTVLLRAVVKNVGNASLRSTTPVEISFSGRTDKVKLTVGKTVAVGDSAVIEYHFDLPALTGSHTFEATVNATGKVPELVYANNTSERVGITIVSPFSLTAQTDRDIYHQGDSVHISGKAIGNACKNAKIEVYFINEGVRQTICATTDEEGCYTVGWKPLSKQSGHFIVGACYPGAKQTEEMDAFDVYGIRAKDNFKTCELSQTDTQSGKIILINPGNLNQTGLTVTPKAESENCVFTYDVPASIGAGESVEIAYTVTGNEISEGREWQQMPLEITTAEGAHLDYTIYYYVHSLKARLQTNQSYINTTMTYGIPREYPVTIKNVGRTETGKITLALPNWIQAVTPSEIASLAQGDSATIILRFIPTDAMKLNVRVSGHIGINCANGDGTAISFNLTPVSDEKGKLKVDVVDEYTFFTNEAPHVSKAKVRVKNPSTNEVVAEGETADDGTFSAELPEGYYSVTVDADKHDSYANTVIVDPGVEKEEEVFLSYQAITYSWDVEETGVEDEYEIETIVKYETRVPKPVVIITLPDEQPEPYSIIPVILTNKGLVNAVDVNLSLSISNGYTLEFLNDPSLEVLAPQQSHVFYAKMVPETGGEAPARAQRASSNSSRCFTLIARAKYKELCQKYTGEELAEQIKKWGTRHCLSSGSGGGGGGSYGGGGGYGPGHGPGYWGNGSYGSGYVIWDTDDPAKFCDKVLNGGDDIPDPNDDVPEEDEEVDDCEKDNPIFNFVLVSSKNGKKRNGVAADGLSNIKIILSKGSKKPKEECGYTYKWTLSPNIGKLSDYESLENIIYTAPEDFPNNTNNSEIVKAILTYTKDGVSQQADPVEIEIIRVPLALIHGLNSNDGCWRDYYNHLLGAGLYEKWQINNVNYGKKPNPTNNSHFSVNYRVATNAINNLKISCLNKGYEVSQVDLVGHSMGGILSRFHVQHNRKQNDVHKLITVNTPHSGSEIGDIATIDPLFGAAAWTFGFRPLDAVHDLAVNSSAIDKDLNGPTRSIGSGVPVHAITTTSPLKTAGVGGLIAIVSKLILMYNHVGEYALYLGDSDAIVSRESQEGGCESISHFGGPMHTDSPNDGNVWSRLTSLLCGSTKSFSTNWFNPNNRTFIPIPIPKSRKRANAVGSNQNVNIIANIEDDSLIVCVDKDGLFKEHLLCASFDDEDIQASDTTSLKCKVPSTFAGDIKVLAICKDNNGNISIDSTFVNISEARTQLTSIYADHISVMKNDSIIVTVNGIWADGSETTIIPELVEPDEKLAYFSEGKLIGIKTGFGSVTIRHKGLECTVPFTVYGTSTSDNDEESDDSPSICSTVTLSFKQKNVMTRQAFRGTLTVNNGNETTAMRDMKMNLEVRDMDGNLTTSHEFQIDAESLNGFEGNLDFTSGWTLEANGTGVATILFIPTKYAAPTEPKDYSFGGSFSYTDPYTGLTVTRDLNPVTLTVNPSPNLEMTYFMQRDVFGDDPLTETVEPMIPSEFALIVNNKGYGDAESMNLTTHQPKIIDNQKGLAINFELISTQLNGGDKNLFLGGSMTSDFGTIPAQSQAYAQWWLQSSLLGHFIEYEVKATHMTSRNNPDLSLLDTVTVHELIHGFTVRTDGDKPLRGFLVNDIKDKDDMPDVVYFTDATQQGAYIASGANIVKQSDTEFVLNVNASATGWNYGSLLDPTFGKQKLVKVTRVDGTEVNIDNVWQTDRTLRDGKDPLYENRLHFVGNMAAEGETFYLTFEPKPAVELEVESYAGVPEEGMVLKEQLTTMTVKFNKPVKAESFTTEDITLTCQGVAQDVSQIVIEQQSEQEFKLTLNEVTLLDGYYVLTVQTADIEDHEGFYGSTGKQAIWIQFVDGTIALKVSASPTDGGTVTPESGRYEYGNDVTLQATPAKGYIFNNWTRNGEIVSTNPEYTTQSISNVDLIAHFSKISYSVEIESNGEGGSVSGAGSGIYEYGTQLSLKAEPFEDYKFKEWSVNGTSVDASNGMLNVIVEENQMIAAIFEREYYRQEMVLVRGWNWLSSYLNESLDLTTMSEDVNRIVGQFDELIRDPQYGLVGGLEKLTAGCAYKIEANRAFSNTYRGHLYDIEAKPLQLHKGWNWIAFPYMEDVSLSTGVSNAEEGDYMVSQLGFAEYAEGQWEGTLRTLMPGEGYLYKSVSDKTLSFDISSGGISNRAMAWTAASHVEQSEGVDIHRYPNTMNMTIQVYKDEVNVSTDDYSIHAFAGNELRGISQQIGNNHYLTVYGEDPVEISFAVEAAATGENYAAAEVLTFRNDVVGSRKSPFILHLDNATGIYSLVDGDRPMTVYSLEGILISRDATLKTLKKLPKGVYIVNGQKCFVK